MRKAQFRLVFNVVIRRNKLWAYSFRSDTCKIDRRRVRTCGRTYRCASECARAWAGAFMFVHV